MILSREWRTVFGFSFLAFLLPFMPVSAERASPVSEYMYTGDLTVPSHLIPSGELLSLEEATRIAIARNLSIQIARTDMQIQNQEEMIAKSIYDTEWEVEADYSQDQEEQANAILGTRVIRGRVRTSLEKKMPTGTTLRLEGQTARNSTNALFSTLNRNYTSYAAVSVEQSLLKNFFGYSDRQRIKQVGLQVKQFQYSKLEEIESLLEEVRHQYWELALAYESLFARREALKWAQDFLSAARDKLEFGLMEKPDVYAAEANVRRRVLEVWESLTNLQTFSYRLKVMLNHPEVPMIYPSTKPDVMESIGPMEEALTQAFQSRWDLKQAQLEIEEQLSEYGIAKNDLWPEVTFNGTYTTSALDRELASSQGEVFSFHHPGYFAGFLFAMPLEHRSERGHFKQAKLAVEKARKQMTLMSWRIQQEVDDSYRRLMLAEETLKQTAKIKELQRKKLEVEERNFRLGRSDSKIVIDYQQDVIDAELQAIQARTDYQKAVDRFYRTQGRLLEHAGVTVEAAAKMTEEKRS